MYNLHIPINLDFIATAIDIFFHKKWWSFLLLITKCIYKMYKQRKVAFDESTYWSSQSDQLALTFFYKFWNGKIHSKLLTLYRIADDIQCIWACCYEIAKISGLIKQKTIF